MLQYFIIDKQEAEIMISNPIAPRQSDYHEIVWIQKGSANFIIDGDQHSVMSNSFFIFPKGRYHQFLPNKLVEGQVIRFSESSIDHFPRLLFSKFNQISEVIINDPDNISLTLLFKAFELEYNHNKKKSPIITYLLKTILYKLNQIKQQQFPYQKTHIYSIDLFDRFQILLDKYITQHRKITFYSNKLNVTRRKLGETIKSIMNDTTENIIAKRLLIEIKRRLIYSTENIGQIAYDLKFEDNSYFTKFFKKLTKITPKEFRRNNKLTQ
tara:strand:- start:1150 stop:1953 length:804 start_codon:yes stop_codon:yes gene_type:complete